MSIAIPAIPVGSPLSTAPSAEHLEQLAAARDGGRKIRRAASVAAFDGWTVGIMGALTLLTGLFSLPTLLLGLGMTVIAWRELKLGGAMRKLDAEAPRALAINQLFLGAILTAYFGWSLYQSAHGAGELSEIAAGEPDAASMLGPIDDLMRHVTAMIYTAMIVASIIVPASTAWYYKSRRKLIVDYLSRTAPWIVELQRKGVAI